MTFLSTSFISLPNFSELVNGLAFKTDTYALDKLIYY